MENNAYNQNQHSQLIMLRHGEREGKTEALTENALSKLKDLGTMLPYMASYRYVSSKLDRTKNTILGLIPQATDNMIETERLEYSPKEWKNVPWKQGVKEFQKAYQESESGTIDLANFHSNLYEKLFTHYMKNTLGVTHDSRMEAAIVKLLSQYQIDEMIEFGAFNNGEGVIFQKSPSGIIYADSVIKNNEVISLSEGGKN